MSKVYLFAVMLLAASFTGCIEGGDELEKSTSPDEEEEDKNDEEETLEPVGEDNMSSLEKRVSDLEAIITEYELPKVYFLNLNENNYTYLGYDIFEFRRSDDGYLNCYYYDRNSCNINAFYYDANGMIQAYSWEGSETEIEYSGLCKEDTEPLICAVSAGGSGWVSQDVCSLTSVNQTITLRVYDNDGNEASASYELDYWTNCQRSYVPPSQVPEISFFVQEGSDGVYHVDIISVRESYPLENYSFYLKDDTGSTYVGGNGFGEIAMQMIGNWSQGIDTQYEEKGGTDQQLIMRDRNITDDDGTEYPVHFSDNDRDGKLSAGDQFLVYGSGNAANGPAADNWRLDIQFDSTGAIVGSATML